VLTEGRKIDEQLPLAGSADAFMGGWYRLRRQAYRGPHAVWIWAYATEDFGYRLPR
jgi:hypothetical protein